LNADDISAFADIGHESWSFGWQVRVAGHSKAILEAIHLVRESAGDLCDRLGLPEPFDSVEGIRDLVNLLGLMPDASRFDLGFALPPDGNVVAEALASLLGLLSRYRKVAAGLSTTYVDDRIKSAPLEVWGMAWAKAERAFWPLSAIGRRRCGKSIKSHFGVVPPVVV